MEHGWYPTSSPRRTPMQIAGRFAVLLDFRGFLILDQPPECYGTWLVSDQLPSSDTLELTTKVLWNMRCPTSPPRRTLSASRETAGSAAKATPAAPTPRPNSRRLIWDLQHRRSVVSGLRTVRRNAAGKSGGLQLSSGGGNEFSLVRDDCVVELVGLEPTTKVLWN